MNPASRLSTATVAARIPYANAAPFYALWGDAPFAVRNLVPRELGREAEAGTVDLGLMASADYLRLSDRFELIRPALGVPAQADALLVIGDRAMRMRSQRPEGFTHTLDLGSEWLEWTGLPFVYAVWAVRGGLDPALKAELGAFLDASLAAGLASLSEVARQQTEAGWTAPEMEGYLRRFRYRLGPEDLKGLERFEELLRRHDLIAHD